jgi:ABC-type transport system involved in multi-copper enzyme maturation permease subunit
MQTTSASLFKNTLGNSRETNWLWGPWGVFRQELLRTLTVGRVATWLMMSLFPPLLIGIATWQVGSGVDGMQEADKYFAIVFLCFILIPQVLTVLGMVLWATPIVYSELEAQTWVYAVVRPGARRAVLIGKYFVALVWTFSSALVALTLAILVSGVSNPLWTWLVMSGISLISAISYAALFLAIGTLIQKRAMVTAFLYAFFIEAILSTLPAAINQLTISHRLRAILFQSLDLGTTSANELAQIFDHETSIPVHLVCLGLFVSLLLGIALWRVQASQFIWQSEV